MQQNIFAVVGSGNNNAAFKSKMISRRQGGGAGSVYENTLRKPTTLPTQIAL
jgi:hypothetical protein